MGHPSAHSAITIFPETREVGLLGVTLAAQFPVFCSVKSLQRKPAGRHGVCLGSNGEVRRRVRSGALWQRKEWAVVGE